MKNKHLNIRRDIAEFVSGLELLSKRKMNYPLEVGEILQIAIQTGLTREFEELIFLAKFLVRTQDVMKQIGPQAEGFEKLSMEFNSSIQKSMDLLKIIAGRAPADVLVEYSETFFAMNTESFGRLMMLYSDLSWVKNWQIDGNPLPYEPVTSKKSAAQIKPVQQTIDHKQNIQLAKSLSLIQRSTILAGILFLLFLFLDPPVTILGWVLSLWIAVLLAYIVMQIVMITRNQNSHRIDFK